MIRYTHQLANQRAKLAALLASWHQAPFSSALFPNSTIRTNRSVSQGENAPGTQVRAADSNEEGFTIPEMLSVIIVTGLFVGLILFFTFSYWRYGSLLEADLDTFVERMNAGDVLREQVGSSSGMIIQNSIPDNNTAQPDPLIASGLYWEPIHAIPGNKTAASGAITPIAYFRRFSAIANGTLAMNGLQPYEDEYVLYINGTSKQLLLRTLANPAVVGNRIKTSCPVNLASTSCPADKILISDLASVDLRYFSRTGNPVDYTSVFDSNINQYIGPDFPVVDVAEFGLNITKKPFLQKTNATVNKTTVRIALRNT